MTDLLSGVLASTSGESSQGQKSPGEQKTPEGSSWLQRIDLALLPILALPLILLRLDDTWLFAYSATGAGCRGCERGFIDPWIYFGYFLDLPQHLVTFRSGYFAGRLPWILPGFLAYRFFSPITAAYVLHLAFYWLAMLSLYLILKHTVGQRPALFSALLMGCYSYFLWAIGWDYVDGAAIAYVLATLCVLTYAAKASNPRRWLVLAGVIFGAAIYSQIFLVTFAPLFALYYRFARDEYDHAHKLLSSHLRPFAWGFLGLTLVFGVLNVALKAAPLFFIIPSLSRAARMVGAGNRWFDPHYKWITGAGWLLFPTVTLVGALFFLSSRESRKTMRGGFRFFWQIYFVFSALLMLAWQAVGEPALQLAYYTSLLIPAMFLALGAQLAAVLERFSRRQFAVLCCGAAILLFLPFAVPLHSGFILTIQEHHWVFPAALGTIGLVLLARQVRYAGTLAVLLLCAAASTLSVATSTRTWGHAGQPDDPALQKQAFLAVVDSVRAVKEIDPTDHLFFWYDVQARLGRLHRSVASTFMWSHRIVSESFPLLGAEAETADLKPRVPPPHTRIAILTDDEGALLKAEQALQRVGLAARFLGQKTITEGPISWKMILIETEKAN